MLNDSITSTFLTKSHLSSIERSCIEYYQQNRNRPSTLENKRTDQIYYRSPLEFQSLTHCWTVDTRPIIVRTRTLNTHHTEVNGNTIILRLPTTQQARVVDKSERGKIWTAQMTMISREIWYGLPLYFI